MKTKIFLSIFLGFLCNFYSIFVIFEHKIKFYFIFRILFHFFKKIVFKFIFFLKKTKSKNCLVINNIFFLFKRGEFLKFSLILVLLHFQYIHKEKRKSVSYLPRVFFLKYHTFYPNSGKFVNILAISIFRHLQ